jgi:hypothetical protein
VKSRRRRKTLSRVAVRPTPLLVFGALLSASLAMRCASKPDPGDADTTGGVSNQGGATASGGTVNGGTSGNVSTGGVGTGGVISTGGSAGSLNGACTITNLATDCPLPPSVCQDGLHLIYYTTPDCELGRCVYGKEIFTCPGFCASGACGASTTTTSTLPPPPDPRCTGGMAGTTGSGSSGVNGGAGAGGAMGARIIFAGAGFGAVGGIAVGGQSGAGGMSGAGAMGSTSCDLPASVCQDATTLIYYTNPYCDVQLQCRFESNTLDCMGPCVNGACQGGFTAPAPP